MNIQEIKIEKLKPYQKNPRKNDEAVKYVANSIKEFGFKVPIIIDKENNIICGHTRYKAAKELKINEVPCVIADDLTDEQIKAFRLADNKVSEQSEWNFELLEEELKDILDINIEEFGFDNISYEELDPYKEWIGMPEFEQNNKEGYQKIVVHFQNRKNVEEFAKLVNQKITDNTKSIWYPMQPKENLKDLSYE